jgi:cytochrome P450
MGDLEEDGHVIDVPSLDPTVPGVFLAPGYFDVLAELRAHAPVHEFAPGMRTVARYDDIREISRDTQRFCSSRGALVNDPMRTGSVTVKSPSILHIDPPEHAVHRKLVNRRFTQRAIAAMEARVRVLACEVLEEVPLDEQIELIDRIAAPLPVLVIAELLGIKDADRGKFRRWSDAAIESTDRPPGEAAEALGELHAFLVEHLERKANDPGDDITSLLVTGAIHGRPLTRDEQIIYVLTLLIAGNETTRTLISGGLLALWQHPDQRERLARDPGLVPGAVEECLRWVTPIQAFARTVTRDTEVGAAHVREGDYLVMLYASGNRDEAVFGPSAQDFDIARPTNPPHLAFGFGEHLCLGAALARLETRILFEELLARAPRYELTEEPTWIPSTLMRGISSMPAVLTSGDGRRSNP